MSAILNLLELKGAPITLAYNARVISGTVINETTT